ncbi:MAG: RNA polymerase sigma factor [candidate division Zixibacteria bacterium]|nr:RNA polymerase sigma factor [candidate division Zixibacteria bacterium]MDH3938018.1 RNA polymerase sigma factor [candidate division Zixibacteria bacterium]
MFWKLLKPVHREAAIFCRRLVGNDDDGDDLYQQALLKAMRGLERLRDHDAFRPWLYRIIVNQHKNRRRSPWWRRRQPLTAENIDAIGVTDPRPTHEHRRQLRQLLTALSSEDQALVVLYEMEDWSIEQLAVAFDRPEGTIKTRLARSRKKLRERFEHDRRKTEQKQTIGDSAYALPGCDTAD